MDFGVKEGLVDKSRSGKPRVISAESRAHVVSLACMKPNDLGYPHEIWTQRLLAERIRENCITEEHPDLSKINQGTISRILNASKIKPHKISSYVAKVDPDFDQKAANVQDTYREAKRINKKKQKMNKLRL
ncbi:MAG: putative transposase [Euryarchaeota archaeon]|nr:putative transposase [Euryarchaeota archaeon]